MQTVCCSRVLSTSIRNQRTQRYTVAMEENKKKGSTRRVHEEGLEKKTSVTEILAKKTFSNADCVCFDVDSTVICEEGIDMLAAAVGKSYEVTQLTNSAMGGSMEFQKALETRLNIIRPNRKMIDNLLTFQPPTITPGMDTLIERLHGKGTTVVLVSGGFRPIVQFVAKKLGIKNENVYCVDLKFDSNGNYSDFDRDGIVSRSGGKRNVMKLLKEKHKSIVFVGDGATDLEAKGVADMMIGFGQNAVREKVKKECDWWVTNATTLIDTLEEARLSKLK